MSRKGNTSLSYDEYISYAKDWQAGLFIPFQYLVQVSCILTVLLSASRMIAVVKPLQAVSERVVWATLSFFLIFFLGLAIGKWLVLLKIAEPRNYIYTMQIEWAEITVIGLMVVVVTVCSVLTIKSLKSPAMGEFANERQDDTQNKRATVMILILSLAFILINGSWIATIFASNITLILETLEKSDKEIQEHLDRIKADNNFLMAMSFTIAIMPINSIVNPLIYIARNRALNEYAKGKLTGILTQIVGLRCN